MDSHVMLYKRLLYKQIKKRAETDKRFKDLLDLINAGKLNLFDIKFIGQAITKFNSGLICQASKEHAQNVKG